MEKALYRCPYLSHLSAPPPRFIHCVQLPHCHTPAWTTKPYSDDSKLAAHSREAVAIGHMPKSVELECEPHLLRKRTRDADDKRVRDYHVSVSWLCVPHRDAARRRHDGRTVGDTEIDGR